MKKVLSFALAIVLVLSLSACGNKTTSKDTNLEGSLEDLITKIYDTADLDDEFREYVVCRSEFTEITSENIEYYLGTDDIEYQEGLVSEPMIQSIAFSLVLLRVKEGADVDAIKTSIKENVDPRKWICVGVEDENVIVDSIGDIVFLVMSDDEAQNLHEAFLNLSK